MTRQSRRRTLWLLPVVVLAIACGRPIASPPAATPFRSLPIDRVELQGHVACEGAGIETLCVETGHWVGGRLTERDGCIAITLDNGSRAGIIWPAGYTARFHPLVVYDQTDAEVARDGSRIEADGWGPVPGPQDPCGDVEFVTLVHPIRTVGG